MNEAEEKRWLAARSTFTDTPTQEDRDAALGFSQVFAAITQSVSWV